MNGSPLSWRPSVRVDEIEPVSITSLAFFLAFVFGVRVSHDLLRVFYWFSIWSDWFSRGGGFVLQFLEVFHAMRSRSSFRFVLWFAETVVHGMS